MSETQYLMAEPLINSILSKGLSNHLTPDTVIGQQNSIDYSHGHGPSSGIPLSTNSYTAQSNTIANSTLSYTYPESSISPAINSGINSVSIVILMDSPIRAILTLIGLMMKLVIILKMIVLF
ncbi:uncharacterized protein LOC111038811 [Myzus persicae]|uniref:uncharacterized protein LOC111038811 n=1 Tax=Myzus persicae TaxID=13164 RepID=UPI000B931A3B|nr:uncharacterized protein LOC111038811 [Myzus persicae]